MQMVLIVVTGTMFANTEPVHKIIVKIASVPKHQAGSYPGISSRYGGIFSSVGRSIDRMCSAGPGSGKKVKGIHYPLLVAAAYVGNAFCLVGYPAPSP